mmetsp:Transcript_25950/g.37993  ORF Transcript_25950/g.37993 Transcript_25950/m.37993 type:complete len:234 (+) Transcript_25950:142-843(+)
MDANCCIEIRLRRSHLNCDSNSLYHLPGTIRCNMNADNFICLGINYDFEERVGLRLWEGVFHRSKSRLVHSNVLELLSGFFLCVSHSSDFRIRENSRGNHFVINRSVHTTEQGIGQPMSFHQRHRCQSNTVCDIAYCIDIIDVRLRIVIDGDKTPFRMDTRRLQSQILNLALATCRHHDSICLNFVSVFCNHREASVIILDDFFRVRIELEINIRIAFHLLSQMFAHILIKSA